MARPMPCQASPNEAGGPQLSVVNSANHLHHSNYKLLLPSAVSRDVPLPTLRRVHAENPGRVFRPGRGCSRDCTCDWEPWGCSIRILREHGCLPSLGKSWPRVVICFGSGASCKWRSSVRRFSIAVVEPLQSICVRFGRLAEWPKSKGLREGSQGP